MPSLTTKENVIKFFIDEEFDENGKTIELISIGIKCEDGRRYYAISLEFNPLKCNQWVKDNVLNQLPSQEMRPDLWKTRRVIRDEVAAFIGNDPKPEFWATSGAYDWVCLNQLYGPMVDHPSNWPFNAQDVNQLRDFARVILGKPYLRAPEQGSGVHDAMKDAEHCEVEYKFYAAQLNNFFRKELF